MALLLTGRRPRAETALWCLPSRSGASLLWTWVLSGRLGPRGLCAAAMPVWAIPPWLAPPVRGSSHFMPTAWCPGPCGGSLCCGRKWGSRWPLPEPRP